MVRFYRAKSVANILAVPAMVVLAFAVVPTASAETTVSTTVCNMDQPSTAVLMVTKPESGYVSQSPTVAVEGIVQDLSQIQIQIDNDYSNTLPIDGGQQTFTTSISVPRGSHKIKLTGIDICQIENQIVEFVVVYVPVPVDAPGPPETVPPGGGKGDATTTDNPAAPDEVIPPLIGGFNEFIKNMEEAGHETLVILDIARPDTSEGIPYMVARSLAVTTGSVALIWPQIVEILQYHWRKLKLWKVRGVTGHFALILAGLALIVFALLS